ncbi:MAG: hypothetical protein ABIP51_13530 [Bacteroidia bacterium]
MKKEDAKIGMKVHPLGVGNRVLYIVEIGDKSAGVSYNKNDKTGMALFYERLVKFKDQS